MSHFYGVYLQNSTLSTAIDLIRFLGEPDSVRFSHITLRGPYQQKLRRMRLREINNNPSFDWCVRLLRPGNFFSNWQFTVMLRVDLMSLRPLFYKPDFPNGVPHLTLYDGKDRDFAADLYNLVCRYDWEQEVSVTRLRQIERKHKVDEVFLSFYLAFNDLFREIVGDPTEIAHMKDVSSTRRLDLINKVLLRSSEQLAKPCLKGIAATV